jgi:Escherichia/Staphylococcus phage prohead protease
MTEGLYFRAVDSQLSVTGDGRTVLGLLAPYNQVALVDDGYGAYYEKFVPGCFDRCITGYASYLRVQLEHNGHWVGRGQEWRDGPKGLAAALRIDATEAGREALFKIRDGQTTGLSLAFRPSANDKEVLEPDGRRVVHRSRVKALHHVALCQVPAYSQATVTAVRSAPEGPPERLQYWKDWTERVRRA